MQWDWGNIALAVAALMGLVVWIINFCCMSYSEESVPGQESPWVDQTEGSNGKDAQAYDFDKRLAVIRSSAEILMDNPSNDVVKRELCKFIIEETEQLTGSVKKV